MQSMNETEVLNLIRNAISEHATKLKIPAETVGIGHRLTEIGIDSLAALETAGSIEETLDIRLPDDQLSRVTTVKELVKLVQQQLGVKKRGAA